MPPISEVVDRGWTWRVVPLCLLVLALPLVYWPDVYDCDLTPKLFVLQAGLALACAVRWIWPGEAPGHRLETGPLLRPLALLLGIGLLAATSATHPLDAGVELANQASLLALFVLVASTFGPGRIAPLLWACALGGLLSGIVGILQYHGLAFLTIPSSALPSATFGNRNCAAILLVCAAPLSGLLFLSTRRRAGIILSGLSTALILVFLVQTRTRSAWVGLAGGILAVSAGVIFSPDLRRSVGKALRARMAVEKKAWAGGFLGLFLVLSTLPPGMPPGIGDEGLPGQKARVLPTALSIFQRDDAAEGDVSRESRLAIWGVTLRMVADHPLFGVGPGGWKSVYPPYDRGETIRPEASFKNPHNDYLWIAAECGLVGMGAYLWLLFAAFRGLWRAARRPNQEASLLALAVAVALIATLGDACFNFPRARPQGGFYLHLLLGLASVSAIAPAAPDSRPSRSGERRLGNRILATAFSARTVVCVLLAVCLGSALLSWRRMMFDRAYLRATHQVETFQDWPSAVATADRALVYGAFRPHVLVLKGIALQRMGDLPGARTAYTRSLALAPHAWQAHADLCALELRAGRYEDAALHGQIASALCPTAAFNRYQLGVAFQQAGKSDLAEQAFRSVLSDPPFEVMARLRMADLFRLRGRPDSATVYDLQTLGLSPENLQARLALARTYESAGRFREALPHAETAAKLRPDLPEAHWVLGLAWGGLGQPDRAEAAYRRVLALQPEFPRARLALGRLRQMRGDDRQALVEYRAYIGGPAVDEADRAVVYRWIQACEDRLKK